MAAIEDFDWNTFAHQVADVLTPIVAQWKKQPEWLVAPVVLAAVICGIEKFKKWYYGKTYEQTKKNYQGAIRENIEAEKVIDQVQKDTSKKIEEVVKKNPDSAKIERPAPPTQEEE